MLQSEAGYIDARPHVRQIDETLLQRTAGPYIATHGRTIMGQALEAERILKRGPDRFDSPGWSQPI